jgi:hypothetical protein
VSDDSTPTSTTSEDASDRGISADPGASADLSFDTVDATDAAVSVETVGDDDPVGVELALDLGAVRCEVVLDGSAAEHVAARLLDSRTALIGSCVGRCSRPSAIGVSWG